MLILAGITIGTLTDDNGIIKQAREAKESTEIAGVEEQIGIAILEAEKKYRNPTLDNVIEELKNNKIISDSSQVDTNTGAIKSDLGYVIEGKLDDYIKIGPHKLGDINDDGTINGDDIYLIQKYIANIVTLTEEQQLRANVDGNGKITVGDAIALQKYISSISEQDKYSYIQPNGLGDVNDDGIIDEEDVELAQQHAMQVITLTEEQRVRADVNKDGEVSLADAVIIQKNIAEE